jgi:hypothetical protein
MSALPSLPRRALGRERRRPARRRSARLPRSCHGPPRAARRALSTPARRPSSRPAGRPPCALPAGPPRSLLRDPWKRRGRLRRAPLHSGPRARGRGSGHRSSAAQGSHALIEALAEAATGALFYFATPHHAWERGTCENTNGLLRQYLPKRTSMAHISQADCDAIAARLNSRPRKRLAFRTPEECYGEAR